MEIKFEIKANDAEAAERMAQRIVRGAPPSLDLKNPRLGTKPKWKTNAGTDAREAWFRFHVDAAVKDLTDFHLRKFLDDQGADVELVNPKFTVDSDLREAKDMRLSDKIGRQRVKEMALEDTPLFMSASPDEKFRNLDISRGLESQTTPRMTAARRQELGI